MKRSKFSLSYTKLFSCDLGELVPCGLTEVNPGDSIQQATAALVRCAPMVAPPMHPVDVRIHHWYVPHRLVWRDFENFITGGPDGNNASLFPTVAVPGGGFAVGSLGDYLGVPPSVGATQPISALPFRGYALIWNEWYRDQDLQTALVVSDASGVDNTTSLAMQNCAWEKDYFTSARPWEQKGPAVTIPLGTRANVSGLGMTTATSYGVAGSTFKDATTTSAGVVYPQANSPATVAVRGTAAGGTGVPDVYADLTNASAITVNALRQALAIQRYEEAAARYGSRYTEYLLRLGIRSSDARLQRPEYLGGGRQRLSFSEIVQTAEGADPVGTLKGHGITAMRSNRYRRFFEEHGYIFTLMSVRPKTIYASGIARHWNRRTKFDFWQPELQHVGQQPILNKEVYLASGSPDGTFGYQDRFDEYRRNESSIAGEFRSILNYWHFARIFGSPPALNSTFVACVPTELPFAVPSEDVLQIQVKHDMQARRLLSPEGTSFIY